MAEAKHDVSALPVAVAVAMPMATAMPMVTSTVPDEVVSMFSRAAGVTYKTQKPAWVGCVAVDVEWTNSSSTVKVKLYGCCPIANVSSSTQWTPDYSRSSSTGSNGSTRESTFASYDAEKRQATYQYTGRDPEGPVSGTTIFDLRADTITIRHNGPNAQLTFVLTKVA